MTLKDEEKKCAYCPDKCEDGNADRGLVVLDYGRKVSNEECDR